MPLKGGGNYDCWLKNFWEILTLDHCWLITIEKKIALKISQALLEEKLVSIIDNGTSVRAGLTMELAKDMYETKIENYEKKLLDYDNKYFQAFMTLSLNCKDGP